MAETAPNIMVKVQTKTAWLSKVNWTQVVGMGATGVGIVFGRQYEMPPEQQVALIAAIQAAQSVATWVIKTWFTPTVTPASVDMAKP